MNNGNQPEPTYVPIPVPYEGDQPIELDPAAVGSTMDDEMYRLNAMWDRDGDGDEWERIFRSTTILFQANAGTFAECLHTAVIWERG